MTNVLHYWGGGRGRVVKHSDRRKVTITVLETSGEIVEVVRFGKGPSTASARTFPSLGVPGSGNERPRPYPSKHKTFLRMRKWLKR